jgi:hypothetical protein
VLDFIGGRLPATFLSTTAAGQLSTGARRVLDKMTDIFSHFLWKSL